MHIRPARERAGRQSSRGEAPRPPAQAAGGGGISPKKKRGLTLMNITGTYTNPKPAETGRTYAPRQYAFTPSQKSDFARRFDSVSIGSERGAMELEARGKLAQEVRTVTSSSLVSALRDQVDSGTYEPDAAAIARRMLLIGEGA